MLTDATDTRGLFASPSLPSAIAWAGRGARREVFALAGLLALVVACYSFRLGDVLIPNMDEGTYLYAAKLIGAGEVPYRDFYLAHPPLMMYFFALPMALSGDEVMVARYVNIVFVLASMAPLYLITRRQVGSTGALLSVALYVVGMLFLANTARTVRLEPFMNVFIITALALYFWRPDERRVRLAVGALFAAAIMVKLVAALPLALLVLGDLVLWRRPGRQFFRSWTIAAAGFLPVLAVVAVALGGVDAFLDDVVIAHLNRPGIPLDLRIENFVSACVRFPAIPFALAAGVVYLVRGADARLRILSLLLLGQAVLLLFAFKSSINYYYIQLLPQAAVITAVVVTLAGRRILGGLWKPALAAGSVIGAAAAVLVYAYVYDETKVEHTTAAATVIEELKRQGGDGYIYATFPGFSLASDRQLYPWRYMIDSFLPRYNGEIGDDAFLKVFGSTDALVFWHFELDFLPKAKAYVEANFREGYRDAYWELWLRK